MQTVAIAFGNTDQCTTPTVEPYFRATPMDQQTRNRIIWRAIRKWCLYTFATILLVTLTSFCMKPGTSIVGELLATTWYVAPIAAASLVLMPLLVLEMIANNKRFTGPIRRVQGELQKLKGGHSIRELKLRDGDHWNELVNDFNELANQIHSERNPNVDDFVPTIFSINGPSK